MQGIKGVIQHDMATRGVQVNVSYWYIHRTSHTAKHMVHFVSLSYLEAWWGAKTPHEEIHDREKKQRLATIVKFKMTERYHNCIQKMVEKIVYEIQSHHTNQTHYYGQCLLLEICFDILMSHICFDEKYLYPILRAMRIIRNMFRQFLLMSQTCFDEKYL